MSFILYNSSAGSGKTYSLVIEYLSIILKNTSKYNRVLAVTFTNKAAAEMKSRIIEFLVKISTGKMDDAAENIAKKMHNTLTTSQIKENAKIVLTKILHNYSDFAIMTIDSFIFKIVSTFSLELNLPLNFEVDMNTKQIIAKTVARLIEQANNSNYIGRIIENFIFSKMEQSESWNYEKDIEDVAYELFSEKSIKYIEELSKLSDHDLIEIIKTLTEKKFEFQNTIKNLAKEAIILIENANLTIDDFKYKKAGFAGRFYKFLIAKKPEDFEPKKRFLEGKETDWVNKNSEHFSLIENLRDSKLESIRADIVNFYNKNIINYLSLEAIIKDYPLTALIRKLKIIIDEYKAENNIVPISDFNKIVSNIIKEEIIPFIYWRVGDKFENYLLDEFQDTSSMQLSNLFPLIENSYSSGYKNIAVGDPKQSIYRWRDSNPQIMGSEIRNLIEEDFFKSKRLEFNYRSSQNIIDFNNKFFSNILNEVREIDHNLDNIYLEDNISQKTLNSTESSGYVEIFANEKKLVKDEFIKLAIKNSIETIFSLIKDGFQYKDITILTRTNTQGSIIAEELFKNGINVISPDSLFLNSSIEIRFIISVLNYIISKENIFLIEMIRFFKYDEFDKLIIKNDFETVKSEIFNNIPEFFNLDSFQKSSIYETVERIIRIFSLNKKKCGYLQGFLEVVFNYSKREQNDIFAFLQFWEEKKDTEECSLIVPSGINAVSIMTIHKSKGLEFPVVIIPFADWSISPVSKGFRKNKFWARENGEFISENTPYLIELKSSLEKTIFSEQYTIEDKNTLLDNLNLLYVAFTRPINRLYLSINMNNSISEVIRNKIIKMGLGKDEDRYYFGKKSHYIPKIKEEKIKLETFKNINSESWDNKISIKENTIGIWDSIDEKADEIKSKNIERGNIIHKILSKIKTIEDKDIVLNEMVFSGLISNEEKLLINKEIDIIFDLPYENTRLASIFTDIGKTYCETSILYNNSIIKPDRVFIKNNEAIIIEYKTGNKKDEDLLQVRKYISIIGKMKYKKISAYIIYLRDKEIIQVTS